MKKNKKIIFIFFIFIIIILKLSYGLKKIEDNKIDIEIKQDLEKNNKINVIVKYTNIYEKNDKIKKIKDKRTLKKVLKEGLVLEIDYNEYLNLLNDNKIKYIVPDRKLRIEIPYDRIRADTGQIEEIRITPILISDEGQIETCYKKKIIDITINDC